MEFVVLKSGAKAALLYEKVAPRKLSINRNYYQSDNLTIPIQFKSQLKVEDYSSQAKHLVL